MSGISLLLMTMAAAVPPAAPVCDDPSVKITLFAEQPQLVTPTGIAVDGTGRVFVAESHTHFRPDEYDGPDTDRILVFEDSDDDGKSDKRTVYHKGFTHVMDIEFHPDGSLYVATRMDIHRMRDTNGDGTADEIQPVVTMKTAGTYPHNGISGLCFNADGSLNFGLGENLGHDYTLIGSDGKEISGGGEGGSTYHVQADGTRLRRVTTGWWNPFGMCVDSCGRVFGTDNDPGASPPCRLIQVHEGADYGYEFRYGRTGLHPLVSWTGDLPGNIPMIAGTGEAPCGIISAEQTSLPDRYRRSLLVASWADHRIEYYSVTQPKDSGQVAAQRQTFIAGPNNFRPVGLAIAPDGSIYVSDWVSASYQLHGLGRVWKVSTSEKKSDAARPSVAGMSDRELMQAASGDPDVGRRVQAVRELLNNRNEPPAQWFDASHPVAVRAEATYHLNMETHAAELLTAAGDTDPVLKHAAIEAMSGQCESPVFHKFLKFPTVPSLLAMKRSGQRSDFVSRGVPGTALSSSDSAIQAVAVKWIADDMLRTYQPTLEKMLNDPAVTPSEYLFITAAIRRLEGGKPTDSPSAGQLIKTATDKHSSEAIQAIALRLLGPDDTGIPTEKLMEFAGSKRRSVRIEAIRLLSGRNDSRSAAALLKIAGGQSTTAAERREAIAALSGRSDQFRDQLFELLHSDDAAEDVLQALVGLEMSDAEVNQLKAMAEKHPQLAQAVWRLMQTKPDRPSSTDTDSWLKLTEGPGDARAGERLFFHSRVGTCGRCHQHGGRGRSVGPSLSLISRRLPADPQAARRWLLETILQPGKDMAPQYTPWTIVTKDGKQLTGLPRRKGGTREAYLGIDGKEFSVRKEDIEFHQESRTSIMPEGLLQNLTDQELRNLMAFLLGS